MKYIVIALVVILLSSRRLMAAIKEGVVFGDEIKPTTRKIIDAAEYVFGKYGIQPTITSALDGHHMANSKHYSGDALDWRIWESDIRGLTSTIVDEMRYYLGLDYDVVLEEDHIHVEYDPK